MNNLYYEFLRDVVVFSSDEFMTFEVLDLFKKWEPTFLNIANVTGIDSGRIYPKFKTQLSESEALKFEAATKAAEHYIHWYVFYGIPEGHKTLNDETYQKVVQVISDTMSVNAELILPDTTIQSMGADSLDTIELIMSLEEEFDIAIDDSSWGMDGITVLDIYEHIRWKTTN